MSNKPNGPDGFDYQQIVLSGEGDNGVPIDLFSEIAENAAKHVSSWDGNRAGRNASKSTQLRKFYDEICMWHEKIQQQPERLEQELPFILMLKAKVAYAKGRGHVEEVYEKIMNRCLNELKEAPKPDTLRNCKLFLEAFTGYYKIYGPKN